MAKAFSVLSWNIEHLKGRDPDRIQRIVTTLASERPDIFAIYEVEGKDVYRDLSTLMPNYTFHITEGEQTQEILLGVKSGITAFFTQKVSFKSGHKYLRPGALLTVAIDGSDYSLLFLHLKSLTKPVGFGIRDDQFERIKKLKGKLDDAAGENSRSNFIALGDFNTMGLNYRGRAYDIPADAELDKLDKDLRVQSVQMRRLTKTAPATFNNGSESSYPPSDLDHVVASNHLEFRNWDNKKPANVLSDQPASGRSEVDVRGWVDAASIAEQDSWIGDYSDHAYLFFQVQKV